MKKKTRNSAGYFISIFLLLATVLFFISCEDTLTAIIEEEIRLAEYEDNTVFNLTGVPGTLTNETDLDIIVGGDELAAYKFKLDNNSWSGELEISIHLTASGLSEGEHILLILGKHESGVWQQEADAESITWTIDTTAPGSINMISCDYNAGVGGIELQWTSPAEQVLVLRSNSTIITSPTLGQSYTVGDSIGAATVIFRGTSDSFTDISAGEGLRYYRSYSHDAAFNYAAGGTPDSDIAYDGYVYVNGNTGSDGYYGISTAPKASIQAGIAIANSTLIDTVRVAEGFYQTNGPVVTLVEGVSIFGGYKNGDWTIRNTNTYISTISDIFVNSAYSLDTPQPAFTAGSGITNNTIVDGFTIVGGHVNVQDATFTTAVFIHSGGAPLIRNCTLIGGTSVASGSSTSVGLTVISSFPVIENNTIIPGTGANKRGIYFSNSGGVISGNTVDGENENGNSPYGIYIAGTNGTLPVYNNTVTNLQSAGGTTYGVYISAGTVNLFNNTIDGGTGGQARAVDFRTGAIVDFVNNIFSGSENDSAPAYGVYETTDSYPQSVRNNNFINTIGGALYRKYTGTKYTTISALQDIFNGLPIDEGSLTVVSNISEDPNFEDSDYRLGISTPSSISQGGVNLSSYGFTTDKDGNTRTFPWSIGAYEYD